MKGLCRTHSHEDEPAWGHLLRAELTGGSRSIRDLGLASLRSAGSPRTQILAFLASCDDTPVLDYSAKHGESLLLGSVARSGRRLASQNGLPLTAGGRGAQRTVPPRACRQCVREDVKQHGYAWFRRRHNLAGIASCYMHGSNLFVAGTAAERSSLSASLAQLESRACNPLGFAYSDDFVRRYEMALLMLVQRRRWRQTWRALIKLIKEQMQTIGVHPSPAELVNLVCNRSNPEWLRQTFSQEGRQPTALDSALAKLFERPSYAYHLALALAGTFTDLSELSFALKMHHCGNRITPLLRAAGCRLHRTAKEVSASAFRT